MIHAILAHIIRTEEITASMISHIQWVETEHYPKTTAAALTMPDSTKPIPGRLGSLDMLRGIAIAGMVLVNNPGSWQHMFPWLRHAGWTGYGLADLVFPFFLFAVGASQSFSLAGTAHTGRLPLNFFIRILRRTLILFLLGLFLNAFPGLLHVVLYAAPPDFSTLRIMGILQRIALVYCAASLCIVLLSERLLWLAIALLLVGYGAVLAGFPGSLSPENNPALIIDRLLLGAPHLYGGGLDPEGLFSSVSALATALLGYKAGLFLRQSHAYVENFVSCLSAPES